jgi:hypothetical protein
MRYLQGHNLRTLYGALPSPNLTTTSPFGLGKLGGFSFASQHLAGTRQIRGATSEGIMENGECVAVATMHQKSQ